MVKMEERPTEAKRLLADCDEGYQLARAKWKAASAADRLDSTPDSQTELAAARSERDEWRRRRTAALRRRHMLTPREDATIAEALVAHFEVEVVVARKAYQSVKGDPAAAATRLASAKHQLVLASKRLERALDRIADLEFVERLQAEKEARRG